MADIPMYRNRTWATWESTAANREALAAALLSDRLGQASPMLQEYMQNRLRDAQTAYQAQGFEQTARGTDAADRTRLLTYLNNVMAGSVNPQDYASSAQRYFGGGLGRDEYTQAWNRYLGGNPEDPYTAMRLMSMIKGWAPEFTSQATYGAPQQRTAWWGQPEPPYGTPATPYLPWLMQRFAPQGSPRG